MNEPKYLPGAPAGIEEQLCRIADALERIAAISPRFLGSWHGKPCYGDENALEATKFLQKRVWDLQQRFGATLEAPPFTPKEPWL